MKTEILSIFLFIHFRHFHPFIYFELKLHRNNTVPVAVSVNQPRLFFRFDIRIADLISECGTISERFSKSAGFSTLVSECSEIIRIILKSAFFSAGIGVRPGEI